jgi:hypothetical protein
MLPVIRRRSCLVCLCGALLGDAQLRPDVTSEPKPKQSATLGKTYLSEWELWVYSQTRPASFQDVGRTDMT